MAPTSPTESDRVEALRRLLVGVGEGHSVDDIIASAGELHVRNNTFPGEATMGLAADALQLADRCRAWWCVDERVEHDVEVIARQRTIVTALPLKLHTQANEPQRGRAH